MDEVPHMPTKEEIHSLPRWAKVALLGRCLERTPPIIKKDWPDITQGALPDRVGRRDRGHFCRSGERDVGQHAD